MAERVKRYPELPVSRIALEEGILERWRAEDLFRRSLEATAGGEPFVFYEGPPTANGRPGLHHIISRTIKDLVCRQRTMLGRSVTRIAGWDTHGLPVEIEAEKELGISGKLEIESYGVARFNQLCRESVFRYKEDWERLSERIGYWLDYSRPYVTFSRDYIETVWWVVATIARKGLLYRGHKIVPSCPRCGTGLSSHEVAQGYQDVADPSLYIELELLDGSARKLLVWTTTPWTLVSNVALAVNPALPYVELEHRGRRLLVAARRVEPLFGEEAAVVEPVDSRTLVGRRYRRPFDLLPDSDVGGDAGRIVPGAFVSDEEGSGIVHLAPAFGADDYAAGQEFGLPVLMPVGDDGRFREDLPLVGGRFVKDADEALIADLKRRGLVFRAGREVHSYPHCWRCESPLLYMARDSWFAATSRIKEMMLANNAQVRWVPPEVGEGRFGEWLAGNVDWALSRDRYWGTPLPVWVCEANPDHAEWVGSYAELERHVGPLPTEFDPHKPWIDALTWPCPECGATLRRAPEVIDVWFDSGCMPYGQWHYPFANRSEWQRHFPADFICEGVDQTRGWFYSLMAISSMLDLGPAYRAVVVNDLILDAEGQKMSKSRGNVVDPWDAIAEHGADAIRWYLVTVSQPWVPKRYDPRGIRESARKHFDTLRNTYHFFALYANVEGWAPSVADPAPAERSLLDRWLLSRLHGLVAQVREDMESYQITRAGRASGDFVLEDLSNWYVRRSRSRFWGNTDVADSRAAFRTLHEALAAVALLTAPITPFVSDWLYRALTAESAHLARFPEADPALRAPALEAQMDAVRRLVSLGRAAREAVQIRVRQPLRRMYAVVPHGLTLEGELLGLLRDELNVKEIEFLGTGKGLVRIYARPSYAALGPRFQARTEAVARAIRGLPAERLEAIRRGEAAAVEVNGAEVALEAGDFEIVEEAEAGRVVKSEGGFIVALDPSVDRDLREEGLARELVNRIQRLRRDAGLEVTDRIRLAIVGPDELVTAASRFREFIAGETLATEVRAVTERAAAAGGPDGPDGYEIVRAVDMDGLEAKIGVSVQPRVTP
ncbi:MAG: isoleucine--tRNA ligase [Gemmatimonadetes bacterium]|nr:isoleucine--tRNA ligase [Gemmatimonadota bacterium]